MSAWLIALTGCIYLFICGEQFMRGNTGMAICYFGYAVGNIGLWKLAS